MAGKQRKNIATEKLKKKTADKEASSNKKEELKENDKQDAKYNIKNEDPSNKGYTLDKNDLGKIILSTKSFGATITETRQSNFTSSDFIYGRLQLNKGANKEAIKIGEKDNKHPQTINNLWGCLFFQNAI